MAGKIHWLQRYRSQLIGRYSRRRAVQLSYVQLVLGPFELTVASAKLKRGSRQQPS